MTNHDLKTPQGVHDYMNESTSETDWNKRCDAVKKPHGGYPSFWFDAVLSKGLVARKMAEWYGR